MEIGCSAKVKGAQTNDKLAIAAFVLVAMLGNARVYTSSISEKFLVFFWPLTFSCA